MEDTDHFARESCYCKGENILDMPSPSLGSPRPMGFPKWDNKLSNHTCRPPAPTCRKRKSSFSVSGIREAERNHPGGEFTRAVRVMLMQHQVLRGAAKDTLEEAIIEILDSVMEAEEGQANPGEVIIDYDDKENWAAILEREENCTAMLERDSSGLEAWDLDDMLSASCCRSCGWMTEECSCSRRMASTSALCTSLSSRSNALRSPVGDDLTVNCGWRSPQRGHLLPVLARDKQA